MGLFLSFFFSLCKVTTKESVCQCVMCLINPIVHFCLHHTVHCTCAGIPHKQKGWERGR